MPASIKAVWLHDGCNGVKIGQESGNGHRLPQESERIENVLDMMQPNPTGLQAQAQSEKVPWPFACLCNDGKRNFCQTFLCFFIIPCDDIRKPKTTISPPTIISLSSF